VPEKKVGATVLCPQCARLCLVPDEAPGSDDERRAEQPGVSPASHCRQGEEAPSLFSGMGWGTLLALGLVAAVVLLALLLAVVGPDAVAGTAQYAMVPLVPACAIVALTILYGHGTSCPSCRKWWARGEVSKEFLARESFEKGGVPYSRSSYRTTYGCESCGHRWSVTGIEEIKTLSQNRTRPRLG
jgi:hypothetical protein